MVHAPSCTSCMRHSFCVDDGSADVRTLAAPSPLPLTTPPPNPHPRLVYVTGVTGAADDEAPLTANEADELDAAIAEAGSREAAAEQLRATFKSRFFTSAFRGVSKHRMKWRAALGLGAIGKKQHSPSVWVEENVRFSLFVCDALVSLAV